MPSPTIDVGLKGGIITGGLGRPACQGMIINFPFSLACFVIPPPPPIPPKQPITGGSIPLEPGEIHGFYQPVDSGAVEGSLVDPRVWNKKKVRIRVISHKFNMEKEYLVPVEGVKALIKVSNLINVTKKNVKIVVSGMRKITTEAIVRVRNLRKKYWS